MSREVLAGAELAVHACGHFTTELLLDRPERANALSNSLVERLVETVSTAYADGTKLLVIRGSGRHFCSGFELDGHSLPEPAKAITRLLRIESLLQLLWWAPFVTIACVQGKAVGAGADLAAACDYRLAASDASFAFPGFRLAGVSLGNRRLAELVGSQRAFDIVLRNKALDSASAVACGLATQIAQDEGVDAFIEDIRRELSGVAKESIRLLRDATRAGANGSRDIERIVQSAVITRERQA